MSEVEKSPSDAPIWYGSDEACAWANGYNAALSAIEGGEGSSAAPIPTEQADGGVVVPRDQLETLRRSLELGNLLPGEGETLINCWIFASEAESKA